MRDRAAALLLPLLLIVGSARSAAAEIVESSYSIVLTGKRTVAGPAGDRIEYVRIGTKDVIERFRDTLGGISGRSLRLVVQRSIEDLGLASACEYLLVDGQYFPVGGTSERIEMPASFSIACRYFSSPRATSVKAAPSRPARPVRPMRWT